jgi:hypothetical protein
MYTTAPEVSRSHGTSGVRNSNSCSISGRIKNGVSYDAKQQVRAACMKEMVGNAY